MTVVIGTAGHIDHGKTTLLRALTGMDADRLPEERRRGMTIDVGYAHLMLPDGTELDFVDVPGHDRLVGNMLVGAGEIDAAMLVVAADDGPRAQTIEHLALLDALAIRHGIAVVTKADVAGASRTAEVVAAVGRLLDGTSFAGAPVIAISSVTGDGIDAVRDALVDLRDRVLAAGFTPPGRSRLAIDRVFAVKGRGAVVTGTLRGATLARGATQRLVPGERTIRVREVQVHGAAMDAAGPGRTALNLAGIEAGELGRGLVLTDDAAVVASDRLLVRLAAPLPDRTRARLHLGTAAVDVAVGRSGRDAIDLPDGTVAAILRLSAPLAVAAGDRAVLRRSSGDDRIVGAVVLDVTPPRGISRRRQTPERVARLAGAVASGDPAAVAEARLELHGVLEPRAGAGGPASVAPDVTAAIAAAVLAVVAAGEGTLASLTEVRSVATRTLRRQATIGRTDGSTVATNLVDELIADGRLVREGPVVRVAGAATAIPHSPDPATIPSMDRLVANLAVTAPAALDVAARAAGCSPAGILELERSGRIVVLEPGLAYAASTYREITAQVLTLAAAAPLTPAVLRDATGTSRKYVMSILADLDRRGILRRTADGHVPGPRAPSAAIRLPGATASRDR
ncbi:MAG: selenocysteine-specific translation elongation factor [Chloroflexota bacterium]